LLHAIAMLAQNHKARLLFVGNVFQEDLPPPNGSTLPIRLTKMPPH